jgi:hypothetical protein
VVDAAHLERASARSPPLGTRGSGRAGCADPARTRCAHTHSFVTPGALRDFLNRQQRRHPGQAAATGSGQGNSRRLGRACLESLADERGVPWQVEVIAIDGTKVHANASQHAARDYEQIAREILEEAGCVDAEEDEQFGDKRGMSYRLSSRPRGGVGDGCARPSAGWMTSALRRLGRFRGRARSG